MSGDLGMCAKGVVFRFQLPVLPDVREAEDFGWCTLNELGGRMSIQSAGTFELGLKYRGFFVRELYI